MWKAPLFLLLLVVTPVAAQDYTVIAVSHADNLISEVHPVTGETLRQFVVMPGVWEGETHEGCVSADGRTAYVSIPYAKHVVILDLDTFTPRGRIESQYFTRASTHTQSTSRGGTRESTSGDPHGVALTPDQSKLYITVEFAEVPGIVAYDIKTGRTTKIDTIVSGNWLGVHPTNGKLYVPNRNSADSVTVIDTATDKVIKVIPVHQGSLPAGVAFGGPGGEVWISGDGDGSVTVIDSRTDKVVKVIQPPTKGSGRIGNTPSGSHVAIAAGKDVTVIDTRTKEIVATVQFAPEGQTGGHGYVVFSPDGGTLHVMNETSGDMATFDMRNLKAAPKRSARIGNNSFGGGVRVIER